MSHHRGLREALEQAAHVLPAQAPLAAFVHHNTLHAFQGSDFHHAVAEAAEALGGTPYMSLDRFREALRTGRIRAEDLDFALDELPDGDISFPLGLSRRDVRELVCRHDLSAPTETELRYRIDEEGLLEHALAPLDIQAETAWLREQTSLEWIDGATVPYETLQERFGPPSSLLESDPEVLALHARWACCERVASPVVLPATRAHDETELASILIPLCAAYLDGGLAYWPMPRRDEGFFRAVLSLLSHAVPLGAAWRAPLLREVRRQRDARWDAWQSFACSMDALQMDESAIETELRALPGWAGMFRRLELKPRDRVRPLEYRLVDYLAVRLLLRRFIEPRIVEEPARQISQAAVLFAFTQYAGVGLEQVATTSASDASALLSAIGRKRREAATILQEAYERQHRHQLLDAVALVARRRRRQEQPEARIQVCCCIDDREESLRRHLEELGTHIETFGTAGFYGLRIEYRGLMDAHARALCPAATEPDHLIVEVPEDEEEGRAWRRRFELAGRMGFAGHVGSRTMLRGLGLSFAGLLESIPMALRTVAPRASHRLREGLRERALRPPRTRLTAIRTEPDGPGYTVDEAADAIAAVLRDMGLRRFAPLVVLLGHGSTSMNNPHEAAHECGACAGGKGGPNARLFADLINRPEVRAALRERDVEVPESTWFVGGMHDTSNDSIVLYDLHRVPDTHRGVLAEAREACDRARTLDAHERVRRFRSVPLGVTPDEALIHVEGRAQDLAEPRPEYGHCTNAICIIGRRWSTRGLFLDRRAFLVSHDPTRDPTGSVLEGLLASVGPVGAGISLEYYFSFVDQDVYGSGTKLPHNVVGLFGVMNGCQSDLRTGLPHQMVDIHEPLRLVTIVEASVERLEEIANRQPDVAELVRNRWIQLVSMDPETGALTEHTRSGWHPYVPKVDGVRSFATSIDAYGGTRDHVAPASIAAGLTQ